MKTCPTCQSTYPDDFSLCPHDGAHLTAQATETEAQLAAGLSRRFRLVRRLGKGGMGTVFLAEQVGVGNRPVALKVLNRKLLDDPDFLLRFQNEAGSTGRIHHPNVVSIYESAQGDDGTPYIAMEYLEGESLREVLKRRGALPVTEVMEILQQAARGLNAAHKLGIIHRDLKPDNIFLTHGDDGELIVKVVDFGIAKLRESATHTQTGTVLGTPAYMSYEQASGMRSDELDSRSDIYSLGVVVYEMLTGRVPFHSDTPVGYLRKHLMEEPPPFRVVKPNLPVPPQIESVVMKALTKDRNQRYGSVLEFAQEFVQASEAGYHPAAQPEPQREAAKPQPQTIVTPVPKTSVPGTVGDTIAAKAVPGTSHPSRRKWLVSRWKRIGIIASIVWILGAGICALKVQSDDDLESINRFCRDTTVGSGPEYGKCLNDETADYAKLVPEERELAGLFAFVPVLLGWGFIYLVLFLVGWISRASIAHPSQRKWLGSHWKKIGIVASVVWILGMGIHILDFARDMDSRLAATLKQDCIDDKLDYSECLKQADVIVAKQLPNHLEDAAGFAFVPVLLGWGFAYLVLFLVRRTNRLPAAAKAPQVQAIPKPPGKMKFVVIAVVALILIVAGVWYFLHHGTNKGDASRFGNAGESKEKIDLTQYGAEAVPVETTRVNPKDGLKYVWIPPGTFMMGCSPGDNECDDNEKPPHQVTITKGFWLGQTEVIVGAYKRFVGATGRQMPPESNHGYRPRNPGWGDEAMPIDMVTWDDAQAYCSWTGGRLPTEAEWEYAARAGSTGARYGPIDEIAWYGYNSGRRRLDREAITGSVFDYMTFDENDNAMHEVGQKRANGFGVYDMLGNVHEWVNDYYDEKYYQTSPSQDPAGPTSGSGLGRTLRGGSWLNSPNEVRVSQRRGSDPGLRFETSGFRCGGEVFAPSSTPPAQEMESPQRGIGARIRN